MVTDIFKVVVESYSFTELLRKIGKCGSAHNIKKYREYLKNNSIDFSHFTLNGARLKPRIEKKCPICDILFQFISNPKRKDQVTCSYKCSNVYFARKRNKPERYKSYRTICFKNHEKKCVVCNEKLIVEVHHYDENKKNNDPKNLVPLCPTHHQYWHSRYRHIIKEKINNYLKNYVIAFKSK